MGTPETPATAPEQLPQLFDPAAVYRQMGLLADGGAIPFVGSLRILAGPDPDSMLAVVALSFQNRGLVFRREANAFVAEYRIELVFRQGTSDIRQVARDERVRVGSFRETLRADESVIFQQLVPVAAGRYVFSVVVRDRNGPRTSRYEQLVDVPRLAAPALATPLAVYSVRPRTDRASVPELVLNPRYTVAYGTDSLRFYIEAYGLPEGLLLVASALDAAGRTGWVDSTRLAGNTPVQSLVVTVPPARLPVGRYELRVAVLGSGEVATTPFLVTFSDLWVVSNLDEVISLLRYFTSPDTLRALGLTPSEERAAAWQRFWAATDPNPVTPENEALDAYFARLQAANIQFREEGVPGWLTDRGEVFITIGEPDEVVDRRAELQGRGRVVVWVYTGHRLTLTFVDDSGFGRFRLDPRSRSEYLRVLNRIRRAT